MFSIKNGGRLGIIMATENQEARIVIEKKPHSGRPQGLIIVCCCETVKLMPIS